MRRRRLAVLVTSVVVSVAANVTAATPALAAETCHPVFSFGTQTIEVLGEPVAHTPRTSLWICVEYPDNLPSAPSVEVTTSPARIVQLVHPDAGGGEASVTVTWELAPYGGPSFGDAETVSLPIPMDGGKTCLFFQGNEVYKPGDCLVAVSGANPTIDELFDALP
ncbi:MAG TPA: hypothetical protein VEU29_03810 [Actinomycetota bacterium]|nr:hypothetical protein [Actinomycetota bacterium]